MKSARARIVIVVLAVAVCAAAARGAEVIDRVLAVVGGQVITLSDVRAILTFGLVQASPTSDPTADALAYLVNRQLMLSEVERYSAPLPDAGAVNKEMASIRSRFPDDAAYQQALARTALTDGRLRDLIGDNIRIRNYLDQRFGAAAQPTPEEVQRYYRDHPADFTRDGRLLPLEQAQAQAFERVTAERRNALIADWLDRLRRRFAVSNLYVPQKPRER